MGLRIAKVLSDYFEVCIFDSDVKKLDASRAAGIQSSDDIGIMFGAWMVIECVFEDISVKKNVFHELEAVVGELAMIATNTSSLPINALCNGLKRPERFIGVHFMNPPEKIDLVEIIPSERTSREVIEKAIEFVKQIKKEPVISKDTTGFILNRILITMLNEAIRVLESGTASLEDIDKTMMLGAKHPIGPLALADMIGLDVVKHIMENFVVSFGSGYAPARLLCDYVAAGRIGKKVGRGFYDYFN